MPPEPPPPPVPLNPDGSITIDIGVQNNTNFTDDDYSSDSLYHSTSGRVMFINVCPCPFAQSAQRLFLTRIDSRRAERKETEQEAEAVNYFEQDRE